MDDDEWFEVQGGLATNAELAAWLGDTAGDIVDGSTRPSRTASAQAFAVEALALGVSASVACIGAPFVIAGSVDGWSIYMRERGGTYRIHVHPDPDRDLWGSERDNLIQCIDTGPEDRLGGGSDSFDEDALRYTIATIRARLAPASL